MTSSKLVVGHFDCYGLGPVACCAAKETPTHLLPLAWDHLRPPLVKGFEGSEGQFCLVCRGEVKHQRIPQRFRRLIHIIFGDEVCRESRADEAQCTAVTSLS